MTERLFPNIDLWDDSQVADQADMYLQLTDPKAATLTEPDELQFAMKAKAELMVEVERRLALRFGGEHLAVLTAQRMAVKAGILP